MRKINKAYNLKIICIILGVLHLCSSIVYALRVPMDQYDRLKKVEKIFAAAMPGSGGISRRDFLKNITAASAGILTIPFTFSIGYTSPRNEGRLEIPSSVGYSLEYQDKDLEAITRSLETAVNRYYQKVRELSMQKEEVSEQEIDRLLTSIVVPVITRILTAYIDKIPIIRKEAENILSHKSEYLIEDAIEILSRYYRSSGKYFNMATSTVTLNDKFIPIMYDFILADIAIVPGGDKYRPSLPGVKIDPEEIAITKTRIPCLTGGPAWANLKYYRVVYDLDKMRMRAEDSWKFMRESGDLMKYKKQDALGRYEARIMFELLHKELGEAFEKGKDYFIEEYKNVQRNVFGTHEFTHFYQYVLDDYYRIKYKDAKVMQYKRESQAYLAQAGHSKYPYFALALILHNLDFSFESPYFDVGFDIAISIRKHSKELHDPHRLILTDTRIWMKIGRPLFFSGFYYDFHRLSRSELIEFIQIQANIKALPRHIIEKFHPDLIKKIKQGLKTQSSLRLNI